MDGDSVALCSLSRNEESNVMPVINPVLHMLAAVALDC
jgi:hypothetical protein